MENTCCFFGHRKIDETEKLGKKVRSITEDLIKDGVDTFLFGSRSRFNDLCLETVTGLKKKYPHIKRVYVRAEYPFINDEYTEYLLQKYEETYYPADIIKSGRSVYVERNYHMIDKSRYCVIYYDKDAAPVCGKSGAQMALSYAIKRKRTVIRV